VSEAQAAYRAKGRQVSFRLWSSTFDLMCEVEARLGMKRADVIQAGLERLQAVGSRRFSAADVCDIINGRHRNTPISVVLSDDGFAIFEKLKSDLQCDGTDVLLSALRVLDGKPTLSALDVLNVLERETK
jgi:hypothetical protein